MNLIGKTYGDWEVIGKDIDRNWNCKCTTCGKIKSIHEYSILHKTPKCTHKLSNDEMVGLYYGDWKVIGVASPTKLLCKCSCGKEKEVNKYTLLDGRSTNCGHLKNKDRVIDLTDKQFGDLKVLRYLGDQYWECECSCKNICKKHRNHLLDGRAHDCGHSRHSNRIDISNQQFGLLTVESYVGNNLWRCRCECGNVILETGPNLRYKGIVSCGCIARHIERNEIIDFSNNFKMKNNRLPYRSEIADFFKVSLRQIYYFISTRDAYEYVIPEFRSKQEKEIHSLLNDDFSIEIGNRNVIKPYELDIYIPDKKLAIEFNGNYWHSELQKDKYYHQNKTFECAKRGIKLIHIFEYEWDNEHTKNIIKNILINKTKHVNIIQSKDIVIQKLKIQNYKQFLDKYNLYGSTPTDINIGCFYNDNLIGVMTFKSINDTYELKRVCFKFGIVVINGVETMFTYFVNRYKPIIISTYVDISKFTGNVYTKLGFKVQEITKPNYVWYNNKKRDTKSRYTTQKSKLVQDGLGGINETEDEIMKRLGYTKIYDSGNLRLIWEASNVQ